MQRAGDQRAVSVTSEVTGDEKSQGSSEPWAYQPARAWPSHAGGSGHATGSPHGTACAQEPPPPPASKLTVRSAWDTTTRSSTEASDSGTATPAGAAMATATVHVRDASPSAGSATRPSAPSSALPPASAHAAQSTPAASRGSSTSEPSSARPATVAGTSAARAASSAPAFTPAAPGASTLASTLSAAAMGAEVTSSAPVFRLTQTACVRLSAPPPTCSAAASAPMSRAYAMPLAASCGAVTVATYVQPASATPCAGHSSPSTSFSQYTVAVTCAPASPCAVAVAGRASPAVTAPISMDTLSKRAMRTVPSPTSQQGIVMVSTGFSGLYTAPSKLHRPVVVSSSQRTNASVPYFLASIVTALPASNEPMTVPSMESVYICA